MVLGNLILGANAISSRLGRMVRENKGLVYTLGSILQLGITTGGQFLIVASGKKANADKLKSAIKSALQSFPDDISEEELQLAKQSLVNSYYVGNFSNNEARADTLAFLAAKGRDMNFVQNYGSMINAITLDQVKTAMKNNIDLDNLVEVVVAEDLKVNDQIIDTSFDAKKYKAVAPRSGLR